MTDTRSTSVQATETTFQILEAIRELDGARTTTVAEHLDMTKSTVYNHLQTLLKNEYIVRNDGVYDVGLKFLRIGEYARERHHISRVGSTEVDKLAEQTKEMANLIVEEHGHGVFLYRSKGSEAVHMDTHTGKRLPLHTTAFGKAILAHYSTEYVEKVIDAHSLPAHTPQTITCRDELYDEFETIREQGYALDREERLEGLRCVSAPILSDGDPIGAISISGPKSRMSGKRFHQEIPEFVSASANVIEINMTFG